MSLKYLLCLLSLWTHIFTAGLTVFSLTVILIYSINISSCLLCDPACHYCASSKENSFHATDFSTAAETRLWTSELTIRLCLLQSWASRSGNVPGNQWTAGRCSKGHNHQRTLLPPANMCRFRCSNYLNVQKLRNGAHIHFWVQKHFTN